MTKEDKADGLRKRNVKKAAAKTSGSKAIQSNARKQDEVKSSINLINGFFDVVSSIIGVTIMIIMSVKYAEYIEMLHENELWFSNIKEVEREISFRSEQGLYYSYYKQIVQSKSMSEAIEELTVDNRTESGHTINVIQRFNIYPEITLAFIYKYFNLQRFIGAIFFYTKFIFYLNGVYTASIYMATWALSGSWIGGILSVALYVFNLSDASRVHYTVPLRESFAGPFIFAQLVCLICYLKYYNKPYKTRKYLCVLFYAICTFAFCMAWQFGQFVLLLQSIVIFVLHLTSIICHSQLCTIFMIDVVVMLANFVLHHGQPMILSSLLLTFIPLALMTTSAHNVFTKTKRGLMLNIIFFSLHLCAVIGLSVILNAHFKKLINTNADEHIFKFVKSKLMLETPNDFETRLYMCNNGFGYIDWETFSRLWSRLLLPIYLPMQAILVPCLCFACASFWKSNQSKSNSVFYTRPQLSFWILLNVAFGLLAVSTLRMKMLWTPQMCVMAAIAVTDYNLWSIPLTRLSSKTRKWLVKVVCYVGCISLIITIVFKMVPIIDSQIEDLKEFWDPDTVELMEYIKANSSASSSVFAGSMQLLAAVKLCTSRTISNHPHFEDKSLRDRTKQVYQIYGRRDPKEVYDILKELKVTHIILEDGICLSGSNQQLCRLADIIDIHNGHLPDSIREHPPAEYSHLQHVQMARFCHQITLSQPPYTKYFKLVFQNNTFRVYALIP